MQLLDVIERVSTHIPTEFICPILDADITEVFMLQDDIPYTFRVRSVRPGWWVMQPFEKHSARLDREAYAYEYLPYLDALPRFYVISLYRLSPHTWLTIPFNASDAAQRGWVNSEPRPMHLVRGAIKPYDIVDARAMGNTMLFARIRSGVVFGKVPNIHNAFKIVREREAHLRREAERLAKEARLKTIEGRFEHQLELAGAKLESWSEAGEEYRIKWSHDGREHEMRVERSGRLRSAGFCLSGRDRDFDLSAIVGVMREVG